MYRPIENYGLIGNMRTAALVGDDGSMDWLCLPHFDSPSVFAAILDDEKGGRFRITAVDEDIRSRQFYWPETNVLVTRFLCPDGIAELIDFMPVGGRYAEHNLIVRAITGMSGEISVRVDCRPAFNYGRDKHEMELTRRGVCFFAPGQSLGLATDMPLKRDGDGVFAEFPLSEGQTAVFILQSVEQGAGCGLPFSEGQAKDQFNQTVAFWRRWLGHCSYAGRWREMVHRSALVLKLLTFEPTGAIVAAPTCSLPERVGGGRNWDYRYVWIRDAAFTVYALIRIGFSEEANRFMEWVEDRCREANPDGSLQLMYTVDGRPEMPELVLDHFEGYAGSSPVRIGNAAHKQLQIDMYGELMDSVYLYNKYCSPISFDLWQSLTRTIDWVCDNWRRPDTGIWEFRGEPRHFVYSKLMSWVAVDRGIRLADKRSFPADRQRWLEVRDAIYRSHFITS